MPFPRSFALSSHCNLLGPPRKLAEIGLASFQECVFSFAAFFGHVEEHGRIARQHLYACLSIQFRIQAGLDEAQRDRALAQDFARPLQCLFLKLRQGTTVLTIPISSDSAALY